MSIETKSPLPTLDRLVEELRSCTLCPRMHRPAVSGGAVVSKVISVGQAPGTREPLVGRPFAWTAGRTLFGWFERTCGMNESEFRASIYMAAVCRCFPGKTKAGGDRVPDPGEIATCARWLDAEISLLQPALILPIGKLAIQQFVPFDKLTEVIGRSFRVTRRGHAFDVIPLPHPSGASPWHRIEPGRTLLEEALRSIVRHPAWPRKVRNRRSVVTGKAA
jgi:uracil-DNA glycosylase